MDTIIQVFARNVYGNVLVYPKNSLAARMADLLGTKTFTGLQLSKMLDMGFTVEHVMDPKACGSLEAQIKGVTYA